jgi:hypothetical protein
VGPIEWFFAGVLATGVVGSVCAILARDLAIPWLLDRVRANRDRAAELEREQRAQDREDAPIRERIVQKIRNLLRAFQRVFIRGSFSLEEWQGWHNQIYELVDSDTGARALGALYRDAMEALNYDQLSINIQIDTERKRAGLTPARDAAPSMSAYLRRQHDAYLTQNVGAATLRFVQVLIALGEENADNEFGDMAREAVALAEATILEAPPLG